MPDKRPWGRGRPPWWPSGEPWPPEGRDWRRARRFLFRRIAVLLGAAFLIFFLFGVISFALFGRHTNHEGWQGGPFFGFGVVLFIGFVLILRSVRRTTAPVGDVMEAAARVAAGDYSVRVREAGPSETRELASAFNAMVQRLESNETRRRDLLADVAHELRTPLAIIRGNAEGLADGLYAADRDHLQPIIDETEIMARLLEDLATLSTAEAGVVSLHREETQPATLIEDARTAFAARAEAASVRLSASAANGLPTLDIDPVRIGEVLANLVSNAIRHTPPGGAVSVEATPGVPAGVAFTVTDTGPGIAPDQLEHIFERFRKAPESRGAGLGLAIAKALVEAHGGAIEALSPPGRGATLRFTLPLRS